MMTEIGIVANKPVFCNLKNKNSNKQIKNDVNFKGKGTQVLQAPMVNNNTSSITSRICAGLLTVSTLGMLNRSNTPKNSDYYLSQANKYETKSEEKSLFSSFYKIKARKAYKNAAKEVEQDAIKSHRAAIRSQRKPLMKNCRLEEEQKFVGDAAKIYLSLSNKYLKDHNFKKANELLDASKKVWKDAIIRQKDLTPPFKRLLTIEHYSQKGLESLKEFAPSVNALSKLNKESEIDKADKTIESYLQGCTDFDCVNRQSKYLIKNVPTFKIIDGINNQNPDINPNPPI